MRLITYTLGSGTPRFGALAGDRVVDIADRKSVV